MRGLYMHLPFCPYLCPYCDFAKWRMEEKLAHRYLEALKAEIALRPRLAVDSVFIGGGTPNMYPAATIRELLETAQEHFGVRPGAEVTIEVNPDLERCTEFAGYLQSGVNRLSIGAQSLDDGELKTLGRGHRAHEVETAVARARAAGFTNVSLDLIFAVPGQSARSWEQTLARAVSFGVDHISVYGLTVEPKTPYERWKARDPSVFLSDDDEAQLYELAVERLSAAGYEQYEISNFACPGKRCAHNANYWANGEYIGVGVGASSFLDGTRSTHSRSIKTYMEAALNGDPIPGTSERLSGQARIGEAIMLALRTAEGVEFSKFRAEYAVDVLERYEEVFRDPNYREMLAVDGRRVRLTQRGRMLANEVCGAFVTSA